MVLVACVAETVFTGLGGGGFAIYYEAATRRRLPRLLRRRPGLAGRRTAPPAGDAIDFGGQLVPYAVGPGDGRGARGARRVWQHCTALGELAWRDVVEPARPLARRRSSFSAAAREGARRRSRRDAARRRRDRATRPVGGARRPARRCATRASTARVRMLRDEGAAAFYAGPIADAMVASGRGRRRRSRPTDLRAYRVRESAAARGRARRGTASSARGDDLDDLLGTLAALGCDGHDGATSRAGWSRCFAPHARRAATRRASRRSTRDGNACAVTTSLGLSSGVWLADSGMHLNSMMGEGELIRGDRRPGERMGSMMTPLVGSR